MMDKIKFENKIWIINWSDFYKEFRIYKYSNPKDAVAWIVNADDAISFIQHTYPEYEIILIRFEDGEVGAILNGEIWKRVK